MTLIDQRILIPAPMLAVWKVVSDHLQLARWRLDVQSVSLLTTEHNRPGTRRRITKQRGKPDVIEEIRIWYEGVGYEYTIIEGSDYRSFTSRIRLQGTADGTIVQWTIDYQYGGLLKRLFGGRRRKKALEDLTANSLRKLRQYIESSGVQLDQTYRDKNRIKQAPDANIRAAYGAKLVAQEQAREAAKSTGDTGGIHIPEPPIRLQDTPSVPQVMPPSFLAEAIASDESAIHEPELKNQDTRPGAPIEENDPAGNASVTTSPASIAKQSLTDNDAVSPVKIEEPVLYHSDTRPRPATSETPAAEPANDTPAPSAQSNAVAASDDASIISASEEPSSEILPSPTSKRDTGEVSIWEVFGMRRPTEELDQIIDELQSNKRTDDKPTENEASDDAPDPVSAIVPSSEPNTTAVNQIDDPEHNEDETQPKFLAVTPPPSSVTVMDNDPTQPKEPSEQDNQVAAPISLDQGSNDVSVDAQKQASEPADSKRATAEQPALTSTTESDEAHDEKTTLQTTSSDDMQASVAEKSKSLEEWLAEDEPPIPESSTDTMKSVVRIHRKPKIGLRRIQQQRQMNIRKPGKDKAKPDDG